MNHTSNDDQKFTVYFDGACPLCSKEIDTYRKLSGAEELFWVDAAHCDADLLGQDLQGDAALARMHVRDESGRLISGAAAFAAIWARLPKTRLLGRLLGTRAALWFLEPAYTLFLKIRPLWRKSANRRR
ncbi:MAG: thiol-disulfide oxidoreductase DCC family protein [Granulosicoccus sp.]